MQAGVATSSLPGRRGCSSRRSIPPRGRGRSIGCSATRISPVGSPGPAGSSCAASSRSSAPPSGPRRSTARRSLPLAFPGACRPFPPGAPAMTSLLLAQDFPPMGGGIARLHGELLKRYPKGKLIVSTPQDPDAAEVDGQFNGAVDRLPVSRRRTKTLPGLLLWSRRAASLARQHHVGFVYCGNVKPAGYPARWVFERTHTPYCIFFYGADLLSEQHKYHHSGFKRHSARAIIGGAAALVAVSSWTRDLALTVLGELGLDGHGQRLRVVHLGTDPERFRPGVDGDELRRRLALPAGRDGARWLLTVARLEPHKGIDTVLQALPAILARAPDIRYAVAGAGAAAEREKL